MSAGTIQGWLSSAPFASQPPEQLVAALGAALVADNNSYSTKQEGILPGCAAVAEKEWPGADVDILDPPGVAGQQQWEVLPPSK